MRYYSNNRTTQKTRNYIKRNYKNIIEGKKNQHKKLKKKNREIENHKGEQEYLHSISNILSKT